MRMQPFRWVAVCTSRFSGCHLEGVMPFTTWAKAFKRAQELDVQAGAILGLHPHRWGTPHQDIIVFYPDYRASPNDIIFYTYNRKAQILHVGHVDTKRGFQCISSQHLFHANKMFRGELMGVKVVRKVIKQGDSEIQLV